MLIETRSQRHLIVLDDKNRGDALHGGEVGAFVRRGRFRRAVTNPRERNARLLPHLECERDPRDDRDHVAHV